MSCVYKINKVKNGYTITRQYDNEEEYEVVVGLDSDDEVDGFAEFLNTINNEFGPSTSRYSSKRIRVIVLPGDKFEGELDKDYLNNLSYLKDEIDYILEE